MDVRQATESDIEAIASVYETCFPREQAHKSWISATYNSFPRSVYFVAERGDEIVGYILWSIKTGFRSNAIVELEQLAVYPDSSGMGYGRQLIELSIPMFKSHIESLGCDLGALMVTTPEGSLAEHLYSSTLGVKNVGCIPQYGAGNELILFNNLTRIN